MQKSTQIFIGLRRDNGQIGYLSEGLTIPEFVNLIQTNKECEHSLIDFSPIIDALHSNHAKSVEQSIREEYNSVFNYWQESRSYTDIQIRMPKFESLSLLSNKLIVSLQTKINESSARYTHRRTTDPGKNLQVVKAVANDCNVFIDILLCFIHSKASLEIESFKKDVLLSRYCDYLREVISKLFSSAVEYSTWNDIFALDTSSLLYHIAFNENNEINTYTKLLPFFDESKDLRIDLLSRSHSEKFNNHEGLINRTEVDCRMPDYQELEAAKTLRDLLFKINSISELIDRLKKGDVKWDPRQDLVEELTQLMFNKNI